MPINNYMLSSGTYDSLVFGSLFLENITHLQKTMEYFYQ